MEKTMVQQLGKGSLVAGALAAISASVCCIGPLALLALDVTEHK
jgi:mercuric ion transport protein